MWRQQCGSNMAQWPNGHHTMEKMYKECSFRGGSGELYILWRNIDDYVRHIFREHNQEVDHVANLGTKEQHKITIEGVPKTKKW